jgi:hypothetical protein
MKHEMLILQDARSPEITQPLRIADGLGLSFPGVKVRFS